MTDERTCDTPRQDMARGVESLAPAAKAGQIWRFGVFEVDTRREELRRSGAVVKTREQSFRILVYLLDHPAKSSPAKNCEVCFGPPIRSSTSITV